jgi:hypothetical protein
MPHDPLDLVVRPPVKKAPTKTIPGPSSAGVEMEGSIRMLNNQPTSRVAEHFAAWVLRRPLRAALGAVCVLQLATWIPHYLTWPMWADHDVFATMAHAWDGGQLPYRDLLSNNFPGAIYLFWVLGRTFGWGQSVALYGFDVTLLVALGALLLLWSRRCFGSILAGLIAYAAVLSFYLGLDFTQTAQREWHGSLFAVFGLLLPQTWPCRPGRIASALVMALALTVRPHAVLFLPALLLTVSEPYRRDGATGKRLAEWSLAFGLFLAAGFAPLIWAGVLDDLLRSIPVFGYGPGAGGRTMHQRIEHIVPQLLNLKVLAIPASVLLLAFASGGVVQRLAMIWLVALFGALLYEPLSPFHHAYLTHPLWLVWCVNAGILGHLISTAPVTSPSVRLVVMLLLLSTTVVPKPRFCSVRGSLRGAAALLAAGEPQHLPPGYTHAFYYVPHYPWEDYRATLNYIRRETDVETRVANVLHGAAITGPTARLSAFPAESTTWLDVVAPGDEDKFIQSLERTPNSIVVWMPSDKRLLDRPRLVSVVRALYEPSVRFGEIEVWRRK